MSLRTGVLRIGDRVRFDGSTHTLVGFSGTTVRLVADDDGVVSVLAATHVQAAPDFSVVNGSSTAVLPPFGLLETVPDRALDRARWWEQHIVELETGRAPGTDDSSTPRPQYDPGLCRLAEREQAKLAELAAVGDSVGLSTLRRMRHNYATAGLWGLVDGRALRTSGPTASADPRLVAAIVAAIAEQTGSSTGTRSRLRLRVETILAAEHGPDAPPMPAKSTFYRLVAALSAGRHTFGSARTRRSLANRPAGPFSSHSVARPGEVVQIDTTPLDVMAVLDEGVTARIELTSAVDLLTRTICAAVLRPAGTKAVDAALLLARMLVPEPMRPGWQDALRMKASVLPHDQLRAIDARLEQAAAKPVIVPDTIVCDRGKVYLSATFLSACERLGISVQPAHPHTPTDKPVVERTFSSINTLFAQYVSGYTGRSSEHRGTDVADRTVWTIGDLQELLDEWIVAAWQNRPHDGLRDRDHPRRALTPNEAYAAHVSAAGYLPVALHGDDYVELLPVTWRTVNDYGIRIDYRTYDSADLNPLRRQDSGITAKRGAWEIHHDPYDLSQIWVRHPHQDSQDSSRWIPVPWTHLGVVRAPFADFTWAHARRLATERHLDDRNETIVAGIVNTLLERAQAGPKPTASDQRVVARTRAATAAPMRPLLPSPPPAAPDAQSQDIQTNDDTLAQVIPFGVFDARQEAEHWR
jgi:transposase InsO family protein